MYLPRATASGPVGSSASPTDGMWKTPYRAPSTTTAIVPRTIFFFLLIGGFQLVKTVRELQARERSGTRSRGLTILAGLHAGHANAADDLAIDDERQAAFHRR